MSHLTLQALQRSQAVAALGRRSLIILGASTMVGVAPRFSRLLGDDGTSDDATAVGSFAVACLTFVGFSISERLTDWASVSGQASFWGSSFSILGCCGADI